MNKLIGGEIIYRRRNVTFYRNLMSFTSHMFVIALTIICCGSLLSDPIVSATIEGSPDIRNLSIHVTGLTNTSVDISWSPPKSTNGVIRYYCVYYYLYDVFDQALPKDLIDIIEDEKIITEERNFTVQDTKCHLEHLESYRHYNITISVCTEKCSERSFPIQVQTGVGFPGRIPKPNVLFRNKTGIVISWHKPMKPHGPIDYYQLIILNHSGPFTSQTVYDGSILPIELVDTLTHENPDNLLYQTNINVFRVHVPECTPHDKDQRIYYAVRAVNNNPLDPQKPFYGPWSVPGSVKCLYLNTIL
ncbi:Fibronectin type III,Immunoglobulin-like fold [Cinara cedri]|uniref:Fibronectin type III,Immunoglobulin-like fold n=1 Tax=Cinara cedri TaxID=506608 RepID=A0A5E4N5K4_9HEMI|nr:Fibronectin type III,Immunoglobulin-like fold [Cinara cedri]